MHNSTVIVHLKVKGPKRIYDIIQVNKDIREKVINEKVCTEIMDSTNLWFCLSICLIVGWSVVEFFSASLQRTCSESLYMKGFEPL